MKEDEKEKTEEVKVLKPEVAKWIIPICCREGWESCPHVVGKQKKVRTNIGL